MGGEIVVQSSEKVEAQSLVRRARVIRVGHTYIPKNESRSFRSTFLNFRVKHDFELRAFKSPAWPVIPLDCEFLLMHGTGCNPIRCAITRRRTGAVMTLSIHI